MVKLDHIVPLTEEESELLTGSLDIISNKENRREIFDGIIESAPETQELFSMVTGVDRQAAFLMNQIARGFNYICYQSFQQMFDVWCRHPKYGVTEAHVKIAIERIMSVVESKSNPDKRIDIVNAWAKASKILQDLMHLSYTRPDEKALDKMKKRVLRSITEGDILAVCESWKAVQAQKTQVGDVLAGILAKNKMIVSKFHEFSIDVMKQAGSILDMIDKCLEQLNDIEMIMPFLKDLGKKHKMMKVTPKLLAAMRPILIKTLRKALGFSFTDELQDSWNRILGFIIGIMMEQARGGDQQSETTNATTAALTPKMVELAQDSWDVIQRCIDMAAETFYKDLLQSKPEIRALFSKTDMASQSKKLLRAIGSVLALLDEPETAVPILEELGRRHVYYNVQPRYFKYVRKCWFKMLQTALALKWTPDVERAWKVCWNYMADIMKTSLEDALLLYVPPEPEKVKIKVLVQHLDRCHASTLSFYGDIWYAAYTGESASQSFAFLSASDDGNTTNDGFGFMPKEMPAFGGLKCLNTMEVTELYRENREKWLRKFDDDTWYMRGRLRGTFAQSYDLHAFPFDQHKLQLMFALEVDDNTAMFDEENLTVRLMPFKMSSMCGADWDVYEPSIKLKSDSAIMGGSSSGKRYTHCFVTVPISRKYSHHVYETILPLWLIEIVTWGVYFAEQYPMVERLAVLATILLTLFAFRWTVAKSLPPTPYLTLMDHFFNTAYFLFFTHVVGLVIISLSVKDHTGFTDNGKHDSTNWIVCVVTFALWVIIHAYLVGRCIYFAKQYPEKQNYDALSTIAKSALSKKIQSVNSLNSNISDVTKKSKVPVVKGPAGKYKVQPVNHEV